MRKFKFAKLVRDKIPEQIEDGGGKVNSHILSDQEYIDELKKKIVEETGEIVDTFEHNDLIKELADVQEIIESILIVLDVSREELQDYQEKKNSKMGSFIERVYIEDVEVSEDNKWIDYYLENSDRYPEIT